MKLDPHIHTEYSLDGVNKPKEIMEYVKRYTGLDAVAITDHNRLFTRKMAEDLTKEYGILVIPGIELGRIRSGKHIVALNLDSIDVNALLRSNDPYEAVEYISGEGGLSIAAHPIPRGYRNFSEIGFDAVEVINGGCPKNNRLIKKPRGLPGIGSSDAHIKQHIGRAWTEIDCMCMGKFDQRTTAGEIRRITDIVLEKIKGGFCYARGEPASDSMYLDYGVLVGKKYIEKSFKALCSLVI